MADGVGLWWRLDGTGPTVLVVPGRGDSSDVYPADFSDALIAAGCSVLRVDPRDTGLSDDGGDAYTFSTMADDLAAVAGAAGVREVHVVALSMGGMVTIDLAVRHPGLVASMVFLGAMSPDPDAGMGPRFFEGIGADPIRGTLASMAAPSEEDERWVRERVTTAQARAGARPDAGMRHQQAALRLGWAEPADLASVRAPTLVLHGTDDLVLPVAHAHAIATGVPGALLHLVDGMAHLPTRQQWAVLAALVASHVAPAARVLGRTSNGPTRPRRRSESR